MKHSDMSKLAQEIRETFYAEAPSSLEHVFIENAGKYERVAFFVRNKVEQAIRETLSVFFNTNTQLPSSIVSETVQEVMAKVLPQDESPQPQPKKESTMTETENKLEDVFFYKLLVPQKTPMSLSWTDVRFQIAKWHDEEMGKLKKRIIGVVKNHASAIGNVTFYDCGNIVAVPNDTLSKIVKEMNDVDKSAEPISPFGCKCWTYSQTGKYWYSSHPIQCGETIRERDKFCRFCGKARVS